MESRELAALIVSTTGFILFGLAISQLTGRPWWGFWGAVGLLGYAFARVSAKRD